MSWRSRHRMEGVEPRTFGGSPGITPGQRAARISRMSLRSVHRFLLNGYNCERTGLAAALLFSMVPLLAFPQSNEMRASSVNQTLVRIAGMEQDIGLLRAQVAQLNVEMERVLRQNAVLREFVQVDAATGKTLSESYASLAEFQKAIADLRIELTATTSRSKTEIVAEVSGQIKRLAKQTEEVLKALARSIEVQPHIVDSFKFRDDYPKEGMAYSVQAGDTLSQIASRFDATVIDIQNANRIADPRSLKAGETIFVPQRVQP